MLHGNHLRFVKRFQKPPKVAWHIRRWHKSISIKVIHVDWVPRHIYTVCVIGYRIMGAKTRRSSAATAAIWIHFVNRIGKRHFRFRLNDIFVERHGRPLTESDQIFNGHFISSTGYILCEQAAIQERKRMFEPVEIWVSESNIKIWCEMIRKNDGDRHKIGLENVFNK